MLDQGKIVKILGSDPGHLDAVVYDAAGQYISPGFVDIHVHGGGGYDFMDGTAEAFIGAGKMHLRHGTTSIVPTTLTCNDEELHNTISCFQETKAKMVNGPNWLGLHLEGPYFSTAQAGAQPPQYLKNPSPLHYLPILDACADIIRVSAAPELSGAHLLGDELLKRGILGSIAHSDADYSQVLEAVSHGYTHVTHLYSGMSTIRRVGPYRKLGVVESTYLLDELTAEFIADGKHIPPELIRLIIKQKPIDRLCAVTDAMRGAGLADGSHVKLGNRKNGQDAVITDGVAILPGKNAFAGSVCTTDRCVRTLVDTGVPLADAVKLMSTNPARIIGVKSKGALELGMDADICIFDDRIHIAVVFVNGKQVIDRGSFSVACITA